MSITFTSQQRKILVMIVDGCGTKEIAYEMKISTETVKFHVAKMLRKTGSQNRTQLAVLAVRNPESLG